MLSIAALLCCPSGFVIVIVWSPGDAPTEDRSRRIEVRSTYVTEFTVTPPVTEAVSWFGATAKPVVPGL
ncbi:MAG: hypothetical protein IPF82_08715 [Blastocatellia bacterium]|nr:hypothetical protein [Blastocatellia bacterium]